MEKMYEVMAIFIEKLKIKELVIALAFAAIIILFLSEDMLNILGLFEWREKYRGGIGATLLICTILCFIWSISMLLDIARGTRHTNGYIKKYLKKMISNEEKEFLIKNYYNYELKEFNVTSMVNIINGCVSALVNAQLIYRATNMGYDVSCWPYNLYPYVRIYLNRALKKRKLIIKDEDHWEWKI